MGLSEIFIRRPVAKFLLAAGLFMAGVVAFLTLPIAPLPRVDFPTINVSAKLPGANPEIWRRPLPHRWSAALVRSRA